MKNNIKKAMSKNIEREKVARTKIKNFKKEEEAKKSKSSNIKREDLKKARADMKGNVQKGLKKDAKENVSRVRRGKKEELEETRLNKFISHNTKYSRREADVLIAEGKVSIDNKVVKNLATKVDKYDKVFVDGHFVKRMDNLFTVLVYNKDKGELVTKKDDRGRKTIYHTLATKYRHFIPVGRLDFASEGLLLLTDNPKIATKLMESKLERVYNIKINGLVTKEMEDAMKNGIEIHGNAGAHKDTKITSMTIAPFYGYQILKNRPEYSRLRVVIGEGQNRELRRFFANFDRDITDLKRVSFGGVELNNLPTAKHRFLTQKEYDDLKEFIFGKKKENAIKEIREVRED